MVASDACEQLKYGGAVAQLGARVNGIHEVAGSIPASSTNLSRPSACNVECSMMNVNLKRSAPTPFDIHY